MKDDDKIDNFLKDLWSNYEKVKEKLSDSDYECDSVQMNKFIDLVEFLTDEADACGGIVDNINLSPKDTMGGIDAYFDVLYLYGEKLQKFCEILKGASAVSFDCDINNRVNVSITVPRIFKRKDE